MTGYRNKLVFRVDIDSVLTVYVRAYAADEALAILGEAFDLPPDTEAEIVFPCYHTMTTDQIAEEYQFIDMNIGEMNAETRYPWTDPAIFRSESLRGVLKAFLNDRLQGPPAPYVPGTPIGPYADDGDLPF